MEIAQLHLLYRTETEEKQIPRFARDDPDRRLFQQPLGLRQPDQ